MYGMCEGFQTALIGARGHYHIIVQYRITLRRKMSPSGEEEGCHFIIATFTHIFHSFLKRFFVLSTHHLRFHPSIGNTRSIALHPTSTKDAFRHRTPLLPLHRVGGFPRIASREPEGGRRKHHHRQRTTSPMVLDQWRPSSPEVPSRLRGRLDQRLLRTE